MPAELIKLLTVFWLGIIELWAAIPAGLALGLDPFAVCVVAAVGAITATVFISVLGERARTWLMRLRRMESGPQSRVYRIWTRYGIVGLGLLSPLLFGAPLGAAIGITLGARPGRLVLWMGIGIVLWSIFLTISASLGLSGIQQLWGQS